VAELSLRGKKEHLERFKLTKWTGDGHLSGMLGDRTQVRTDRRITAAVDYIADLGGIAMRRENRAEALLAAYRATEPMKQGSSRD